MATRKRLRTPPSPVLETDSHLVISSKLRQAARALDDKEFEIYLAGVPEVAKKKIDDHMLARLRKMIKNKMGARESRRRRDEHIKSLEVENARLKVEVEEMKKKLETYEGGLASFYFDPNDPWWEQAEFEKEPVGLLVSEPYTVELF